MAKSFTTCIGKFGSNLTEQDRATLNSIIDDKKSEGVKNPALAAVNEMLDELTTQRTGLVKEIEAAGGKGFADTSDVGGEMSFNRRQKGFSRADIDAAENETSKAAMAVKSKLWERPDYQAMVDSGTQPVIAHIVKQLYDSLSTKPAHGGEKYLNAYVDVVIEMKAAVDSFLNNSSAMRELLGSVIKQLKEREQAMGGYEVSIMNLGKRRKGFDYFVDKIFPENDSGNRWGRSNMEGNLRANATGNRFYKTTSLSLSNFQKAMEAIKDSGFPAKMESWQRSYKIVEKDGKFGVVKNKRYRATSEHATREEAVEAARDLVKRDKVDRFKEPDTLVENSIRKGRALRDGKNVSSVDLQKLANLKRINFGTWMKKPANAKERQGHVNSAYDAFLDLAELLNVPPEALSLNGKLGLAIGAQGKGGKSAAAAHFVPGINEINLTRRMGAGSLAHEFAHGLDHYFGVRDGLDGKSEPFLSHSSTRRYATKNSEVRPEIVKAFATIMQVMTKTTESKESAQKRADSSLKNSETVLLRFVEAHDLKAKVKGNEKAEKALDNIINGVESEYTTWPPATKRKRKPEGYTNEDVKTVADAIDWNFRKADDLQSHSGSYNYHKKASETAPTQVTIHTDFYQNARLLETPTGKPYWSTPHELFARAFEIYVSSKLAETDGRNDYLTSKWKQSTDLNDALGIEAALRYPQDADRKAINDAFDTLIGEFKTKQVGENVELYSKGDLDEGLSIGATEDTLRQDARLGKAMDAGLLKVVEKADDIPTGAELFMTVWHGSGAVFDKFLEKHINSGEGNQSYSWGFYFGQKRATAETYMEKVDGRLYKVDIAPDESEFMDWDKRLIDQPKMLKMLDIDPNKKIIMPNRLTADMTGQQVYSLLARGRTNRSVRPTPKDASKYLLGLGIKGMIYLDSESKKQGEGSKNMVVYDEADVSIVDSSGNLLSKNQSVEGATLNGVAYVVADANTEQSAPVTAYHELTHVAMNDSGFMDSSERTQLLDRLANIRKLGKKNKFWQKVEQHVADANTPSEHVLDEIAGYAVTEYLNGNKTLPTGLVAWVKKFIAALKNIVAKFTGQPAGKITPQELLAMTASYVDSATDTRGAADTPLFSKGENYLVKDWQSATGIPIEQLNKYREAGDLQRAKPERLMVSAQRLLGGGVLSYAIEHVGDISNRMSPNHGFGWAADATADKVEKTLRTLDSGYGFRREFDENMANNDVNREKVDEALSDYADAHATLPVYNRAQWLAREAAVMLGRQKFEQATEYLRELLPLVDTEADFKKALSEFNENYDNNPVLFSKKGKNTGWRTQKGFEGLDDSTLSAAAKTGTSPNEDLGEHVQGLWNKAKERAVPKLRQGIIDQYESIKSVLGDSKSWMLAQMAGAAGGVVEMIMVGGSPYLHKDGVAKIDTKKKSLGQVFHPLGHETQRFLMWVAGNRAYNINERSKEAEAKIEPLKKEIARLKAYVNGGADYTSLNTDGTRGDMHDHADLNLSRKQLKEKEAELKAAKATAQVKERLFSDKEMVDLKALNKNGNGKKWAEREKVYEEVRKDFEALHADVVKFGVDAGLVSRADATIWKEQGFYIPFYRLADEDDNNKHGVSSVSGLVGQQAYKKLKGADMQLDDLLLNTIMNWEHIIGASLKNQAARSALESAKKIGLAREVAKHNKGKNSIFVREDGKEFWYDIDTSTDGKLVLESLTSLNYQGLDTAAMKVLRKFKRILTIGVTASPEFKIANLIRDTLQAIAVADMDTNFLKNVKKGWKATGKLSEANIQAIAAGGLFGDSGYINGNDPDAIKMVMAKALGQTEILDTEHKVKKWWNKYQDLGARLENVNRMANIEESIGKGKDLLTANFEGRDHLDFQRSGAFTAVRVLTQTIPFLNARFQGLDKLGRAFADPKQRRQAISVIGTYAVASVLLYLYMKDDEDYKQAEQWERDTYHLIKIPGTDKMIRIPRPFEVGVIANLVERGFEQFVDPDVKGKVFLERVQHMLSETLALGVIPQAISPMMDIRANKSSFTDRSIESMSMQRLSPENRTKPWTSQFAIAASPIINATGKEVSPIQIDYLINGYFGWMGSTVLSGIDLLARPMVGAPAEPSKQIQDYPVVGRFFRESAGRNSRQLTELYDVRNELNRQYADIQHYKAIKEMDKYREELQEWRSSGDATLRKRFNKVAMRLNKYSAQIKTVARNKNLTAEQMRDKINRINIKRLNVARDALQSGRK